MTLCALLDHLSNVAALSEENNMTAENLSIVMGPTLSWSQTGAKVSDITTMITKQNNIVAFLITNYPKLELPRE